MLSLKYQILKEGIKLISDEMVENLGKQENLKLYDIAFNANNNDYEAYFYDFCVDNYEQFKEVEKSFYTKREYIGRTSSFYIVSNGGCIGSCYNGEDYSNLSDLDKKIMIIDEYLTSRISGMINIHDDMSVFDADIRYISEYDEDSQIIEEIIEDMKQYLLSDLEEINNTYKYIANFKENQVKYWDKYIERLKLEEF